MQVEVKIESVPTGALVPHPANVQIYGEDPYYGDLLDSKKEGSILRPITIDPNRMVIDGTRRLATAKVLGLETVPCEIREFEDEDQAVSAILTYNRYRQKTPWQIFNESRELKRIETEKAQRRMKGGAPISAELFPSASWLSRSLSS